METYLLPMLAELSGVVKEFLTPAKANPAALVGRGKASRCRRAVVQGHFPERQGVADGEAGPGAA
jgi:hypothetical protein